MAQSEERRREPRIKALNLVNVADYEGGELSELIMGRTADLSASGLSIELSKALTEGEVLTLSVALDEDVLELKGRVVGVRDLQDGSFAHGVALTEVDEATQTTLDGWLASHGG